MKPNHSQFDNADVPEWWNEDWTSEDAAAFKADQEAEATNKKRLGKDPDGYLPADKPPF